jgi:hypothetical protein
MEAIGQGLLLALVQTAQVSQVGIGQGSQSEGREGLHTTSASHHLLEMDKRIAAILLAMG